MAEAAELRDPVKLVFGTAELLEEILAGLDMKTLLLSQRVDKTFEATIAGSTRLQQKLFLAPLPADSTYHCTETNCGERTCWNCGQRSTRYNVPSTAQITGGACHINPLFARNIYLHTSKRAHRRQDRAHFNVGTAYQTWTGAAPPNMHLGLRVETDRALVQASWRKMYACQPVRPVTFVTTHLCPDPSHMLKEGPGGPRTAEELLRHYRSRYPRPI